MLPPEQREALVIAMELGDLDVPRKAGLGDLAAALGVPPDIAAVRLRQAMKTHLANTLVAEAGLAG